MIEAALALAAAGVEVFPVNPDKTPRTPRGFHDATADPDHIRAWGDIGVWDDALIGHPPKSGVIILDVDPRNGGENTLALFPALPRTRTTKTRSGGRHYWLTVDPSLKLRGTLGPGIDVKRHAKGYVIIPPSDGYEYVVFGAMAPAPQWLVDELVVVERPIEETAPSDAKYFPFERGTTYGLAALRNVLERLAEAENGVRNEELNKASFALAQLVAGGELAPDAAIHGLLKVAEELRLSDFETRRTIESGWRAGEKVPRQAPARVTA